MTASRSRKRSAANSTSRPPRPLTYFLDRSLGKVKLAGALRTAGLLVEVHDDHFPPDAADDEWLTEVGQKGWVVLTKDERIRYHRRELRAVLAHGVRAFVLTAHGITADEMALVVLSARKKIEDFLSRHHGPFLVSLSRAGTLRALWPKPRRQ